MRSMSSEKRSIIPKAFESAVPPLKIIGGLLFKENKCFSVQTTQKSFSIMTEIVLRRCAVASKYGWRSATLNPANDSKSMTRSSE